ncbi:MAG: DUF6538 domain-containing protein [Pseudomonadota bacterium]
MPRPSYLYRRNGTYYVVRRVPTELVNQYGKQSVRRSLKTADFSAARRQSWAELTQIEGEFWRWFESNVTHGSGQQLSTKTLSVAIKDWIVDQSPHWSSKMMGDVAFVMPVVLSIRRDRPAARIKRAEIRDMKATVSRLPTKFNKLRLIHSRSIPEVIRVAEAHRLHRLSTASVNRYIGHTNSLFEWYVREQIMGSNPAKVITGQCTQS